ncbi:DISARM system helicase DrmA [Myxococcus xanthus]|uniref:Helicase n=1 Tax=Myxococcus xanthus TaxID=34 RepID=A0A7Y4IDQ5_MYXXA|nr:DISARM system helicase DrmA [Myxococcus xanthus]NOJ77401.1 helicase [Myxococcus xanthus]NOJ88152.1 helicase [Myxococcus xanthus]
MNAPDTGAVRSHLIDALEADLVGPFHKPPGAPVSDAPEALRTPPSRWYLTGFLVPLDQGVIEDDPDDEEDDLAAGNDEDNEEASRPDPTAKKVRRLPASMGLSVFVPVDTTQLTAHVCWADYQRVEAEGRKHWRRTFHQRTVTLSLNDAALREGLYLQDSRGLRLEGHVEKTREGELAVAIFLVNARPPTSTAVDRDEAYAFQTHLALECEQGFVSRQDSSDARSEDDDDRVNDLQFRDRQRWAVGHGISVRVPSISVPVTRVETDWLPRVEVLPVEARQIDEVTVGMEQLAAFTTPSEAVAALLPLVRTYREWVATQATVAVGSERREETRDELIRRARRAADRIEEGIQLLKREPLAFDAFRWMNSVMAQAERKVRQEEAPKWRLFQLAFILLNLPSVEHEGHADRELVELIFFPTGGGKTQAYLGLIAFTLLLRRLRGQAHLHGGLGVAVLLRYTLRLLTLDQLGRAATLICALEVLRKQEPKRLGAVRFSIGLWVGRSATANTLEQASTQITEYKNDNSARAQSPFPLATCPWCATPFERECFILRPSKSKPEEVLVGCANIACAFNLGRNPEGLPVLFVDEQIYRELPCFLVATVDKFAMLPWRGETGLLFGRVLGRTGKRFVGPCNDVADVKAALVTLPRGLPPPELIVQDELHLISGPLGSMVGLYEGAVLTLAPRAKLVASTATVRRSRQQVSRLYGRDVALFPPPGVDASETFFASVGKKGARQYVGVAAPGRPMKAILLRVYVSLLAAAARGEQLHGAVSADPYLTLVGYFNSLRELGGMRRLVEDEVRRLVMDRVRRRPEDFGREAEHPWYRGRTIRGEPIELTSREKTADIKASKSRLELTHGQPQSIDVVLASNMISVGVDIDRLGLMVVAGQPKTTSEYIQASSRVGRKMNKPGLVVTCLNAAKPRDRSHYERFGTYHESFYRFVEATSVTPFSAPALDRGLAGVVVALGRLLDTAMTAPLEWKSLQAHRDALEQALETLSKRAGRGLPKEESERASGIVMQRARSLLDSWRNIIEQAKKDAAQRAYSPYDPEGKGLKPLLRGFLDPTDNLTQDELKFEAPTSMRDVESSVHLWISRQPLGGYRAPKAATEEVAHDEP